MNQAPTQEESKPYVRKQTGGDKSSPYNRPDPCNKSDPYSKLNPYNTFK